MKAIWSGYIELGLVSIPIKLYSAINKKTFSFHILCSDCKTPLKYKRWCPRCKKEVLWENVVKAVKIKRDKYIIINKHQLKKLRSLNKKIIEIEAFIDKSMIEPIFYDHHYYLIPNQVSEKSYFLFKELLALTNKLAIARFILKEREHIAVIASYKWGLLLSTLNYAYEINKIEEFEEIRKKPRLTKKEIEVGKELIKSYYDKSFKLDRYKDEFNEKLKALVLGKVKVLIEKEKSMKREPIIKLIEKTIKKKKKR